MKTKTLISVIFAISVISASLILLLVSCKKNNVVDEQYPGLSISKQELSQVDNSINSVLKLKKEYALQFEFRDKVNVDNIYYSDEIKEGVIYQLLMLASVGLIKEYSQEIQVLYDEAFTTKNNTIVVPAIEKFNTLVVPPLPQEKFESDGIEKLFFWFIKEKGEWKITKIEALTPQYEVSTKYDITKVYNWAPTITEAAEKAKIDEDARFLYEVRKIENQFFEMKIDREAFDQKMNEFYKENNLLPNEIISTKQNSLNKGSVVYYGTKYTDNTGGNSTIKYNSAYKAYVGNDCANFVSQCLKYGGWGYVNNQCPDWWYNNKNTSSTSDDTHSSSWAGANALYLYIIPYNGIKKTYSQAKSGSAGNADVFWLPASGYKTHAMIITQYVKSGSVYLIYYSAHTNNRLNYSLGTYSNVVFAHLP